MLRLVFCQGGYLNTYINTVWLAYYVIVDRQGMTVNRA